MAQSTKEAKHERIEIVDQPEEEMKRKGKARFVIPLLLVAALTAILFVVRRFNDEGDN